MDTEEFESQLKNTIQSLEPKEIVVAGFRSAAVIVPLLHSEIGWELLFTVRSPHLSNHAGQISFPGGKVDEGESIEEAAIRELEEEVGVPAERLLGRLGQHPSPARFVVTPVVAVLAWPQKIVPNPAEVAEVFTVPLAKLVDLRPRIETRTFDEYSRVIRFYQYEKRMIWGLTGNIVHELIEILPT